MDTNLSLIHFGAKRFGHHEKTQKFGLIHFFLSKIHIFINVFSNKIIDWKIFSLIIISENIKIIMLQKDKATYEFIK